LNFGDYDIFIH